MTKGKIRKKRLQTRYVNDIIEVAWDELKMKSIQRKNIRLEKAAFCTLAARTSTWRISDPEAASPKRKREGDWHGKSTPLKKLKGWWGEGPKNHTKPTKISSKIASKIEALNLPECTVAISPPSPIRNPVQQQIKNIEEKYTKSGPEKTPQPRKMPQVKTKKWVKGKNGLFRWVSSLKPGTSVEPNQTKGVTNQYKEIFGKYGGDGPAAVAITDQKRK